MTNAFKSRVLNFSPGPACLPLEVLKEIESELLNYRNTQGWSVLEMSHRSKEYKFIQEEAIGNLKEILEIPGNYDVLLMHGGGTGQFSAVPLNLLSRSPIKKASYAVTGSWSTKAAEEAQKYGTVDIVANPGKFTVIPDVKDWKIDNDNAYLHYCDNETIEGLEFPFVPECALPLVCDMSSNICTRKIDVNKFDLIYAGAQKNIGVSGVTVVIVKKDHCKGTFEMSTCPSILSYSVTSSYKSVYNTPSVFSVYVLGLMMKWIKKKGGLSKMEEIASNKSDLFYDSLSLSRGFYISEVDVKYRSRMNAVFKIFDQKLEDRFITECYSNGFCGLEGHRSVGGFRASLYTGMEYEGVRKLIDFMEKFQENHESLI